MPAESAIIRQIIDRGLFDRLPATFSSYTFDRIRAWTMLFPAEQSYFERLLGMLDRSDPALVDQLFAPLAAVEKKMGVDRKAWTTREFNLGHVDFLQRSPHYAEWRRVIGDIFARIDPLLEEEVARNLSRPRLVIVAAPSEIPASPDRMWKRIDAHGKRVPLKVADDMDVADYLPLLLTGKPRAAAPSLFSLNFGEPYAKWLIEAGASLSAIGTGAVTLSYAALEEYRNGLMKSVRDMLETKQLRGPQQLGTELRRLKTHAPPGDLGRDPLLADFVRSVMLAGNGTLLLNNTFTEWATVQAVRRARPVLTVVSFGVRNKIKPFSSLLIYQDQESATPIPSQMDTLGTFVDLEIFYQYVWQEFEKYAEYRGNTAYLFVGEGLDEMLVIAPPRFPLMKAAGPAALDAVHGDLRRWLA
jgi:hypothetical protein